MLIFEAVVYETPPQQAEILLDESLFPRIASGDKAAFLALYEKCSSPVFAYALSILRSRSDSEDAMQDTLSEAPHISISRWESLWPGSLRSPEISA